MTREIIVFAGRDERAALLELSRLDLRDPSAQVCFLIREEAKRRGILSESWQARPVTETRHGGRPGAAALAVANT